MNKNRTYQLHDGTAKTIHDVLTMVVKTEYFTPEQNLDIETARGTLEAQNPELRD